VQDGGREGRQGLSYLTSILHNNTLTVIVQNGVMMAFLILPPPTPSRPTKGNDIPAARRIAPRNAADQDAPDRPETAAT